MWADLAGYGPSHLSKSVFWARRAGPLLGLLWMDAGMAQSPLCFWAGGWDIWPISLSLSGHIHKHITNVIITDYNIKIYFKLIL